jgi:thiol:disulfide interchange protein DsbD
VAKRRSELPHLGGGISVREMLTWNRVVGAAVSLLLAGASSTNAAAIAGEPPAKPAGSAGEPALQHATPKLIADVAALVPGQTAHLLISFEIRPHWHMYWNGQNDTGLPATWKPVDWPEGFALGESGWPGPKRIVLDGGIRDHIYEGQFGVVVELKVPATAKPGTSVTLPLHVEWMVCDRLCVLEEQDLSVTLPIAEPGATSKGAEGAKLIEAARKRIPRGATLAAERVSRAQIRVNDRALVIRVPGAAEIEFFPSATGSDPQDPIAGTVGKGEELSVAFAGPTGPAKAAGIVAWRAAEDGGWEYDWVDGAATLAPAKPEMQPAQIAPTP